MKGKKKRRTGEPKKTGNHAQDARHDDPEVESQRSEDIRSSQRSKTRVEIDQRAGEQNDGRGKNAEGEILRIEELRNGDEIRVRVEVDENTVEDYAERLNDGAEFDPITVFRDGDRLRVADGFHRLEAHHRTGRTTIAAKVQNGTAEDAQWFEAGANARHGRKLTNADKRRAIDIVLSKWPETTNAEIAKHVGCGSKLVKQVRQEKENAQRPPEANNGRDAGDDNADNRTTTQGEHQGNRQSEDDPDELETGGEERGQGRTSGNEAEEPRRTQAANRQVQNESNRCVASLADQMEHFGTQLEVVEYTTLDRNELSGWIANLKTGRTALAGLIHKLEHEVASGD